MLQKALRIFLSLSLLSLCTSPQAQTWQLGLAVESSRSPFIDGQRRSQALPLINYIDERFRFINGRAAWSLVSAPDRDTYLLAQYRPRQFYSASLNSSDQLDIEGMRNRDGAFEAGFGHTRQTVWGKVLLEGVADVSNTHKGYALSASYSYPWIVVPLERRDDYMAALEIASVEGEIGPFAELLAGLKGKTQR